jgi:hypothetical protein
MVEMVFASADTPGFSYCDWMEEEEEEEEGRRDEVGIRVRRDVREVL